MKVLSTWLADFVDLGELAAPEKLSSLLASAGIGTESVERFDGGFVLELEITANRPDLLSHFGLAREIGALTGRAVRPPAAPALPAGGSYPIVLESPRCTRYGGVVMRGVRVGPSPAWLAERLSRVGLRPISNVVDATNYVLMELNHPLHAFDLGTLEERIVVRQARGGESIRLLDERTCRLDPDDLVIADASRPVALAGVMGGAETAVTGASTDLLLEAAWFQPSSVRRTARRHGISTDASYRFERGADFEAIPAALARLAEVIRTTAGGTIEAGLVDARSAESSSPAIRFRSSAVARHLGLDVPDTPRILAAIGCRVEGESVTPPSWRGDLAREIDLVEEVARLNGYDHLPATLPAFGGRSADFCGEPGPGFEAASDSATGAPATAWRAFRASVAGILAAQGYDRCVSFTFEEERFGALSLSNPLNSEMGTLRSSLLPSLARAARLREDRRVDRPSFVAEIDKVFHRDAGRAAERYAAAFVASGLAEPKRYDGRSADAAALDHVLGALRVLATRLRAPLEIRPVPPDAEEPPAFRGVHERLFTHSSAVLVAGRRVGRAGLLDRASILGKRAAETGAAAVEEPMWACELDLVSLWDAIGRAVAVPQYRPLPRFPASSRDLAFWVPNGMPASAVVEAARAARPAFLESLDLFDVFVSKRENRTSIGIRLVFRDAARTLTDADVTKSVEAVIASVTAACRAELRAQ